jgi:hypothetical protein
MYIFPDSTIQSQGKKGWPYLSSSDCGVEVLWDMETLAGQAEE